MQNLPDALIQYLMLIALLTFHEYGHAWMAWKCGDDTARLQGRLSLNPLVHIDPIGTVLMPLLMVLLPQSLGRFLIGGAKPVPVNPYNYRHPNRDDVLVTLAGPGMNLILAVFLLGFARILVVVGGHGQTINDVLDLLLRAADLSLFLCFFNLLLPVPPLDGSHIARALIGMSHENYAKLTQWGFIPVILLWQIPFVPAFVTGVTDTVFRLIAFGFGF